MDLGLAGYAVLVGGGSRGIGRAVAEGFLREGARVAIAARGQEELEKVHAGFAAKFGADKVHQVSADLTSPAGVTTAVRSSVSAFGALDILIANVGKGNVPRATDRPLDEWREVLRLNLTGSMELAAQAAKEMEGNARGGSIVFVSSIAGVEDIGASLSYTAAKAGLIAASKGFAKLVAPRIRVNTVAPGNVLFPGGSWDQKLSERRDEIMKTIESGVALKRFGTPEEIAAAVIFLASPAASFATGSCLVIDGGQTRSW